MTTSLRRGRIAAVSIPAIAALALTGCSGSALGGGDTASDGPISIGLLVPQSGVYTSIGEDQLAGFELYLEQNGGELGGREVDLVIADEGETADTARSGAEKLIRQDEVLAMSGLAGSVALNGALDLIEQEGVPMLGSNASPTTLDDVAYLWRTSYVNDEPGKALGEYVAENEDGSVYALAADYQAGYDEVEGFTETFEPAGGEFAGEAWSPHPTTTNFQPFLSNAESSGGSVLFSFYAGSAAVEYVKQFDQFGIDDAMTLYAPGFLTEGGILAAQGDAAIGVRTSMNYSPDLDNDANAEFVDAYVEAYDRLPTAYAVYSYDAAAILDAAIEAAGDDLTRETLNAAIGEVGTIESPRGEWEWNEGKTPRQPWYLREVVEQDGELVNEVIADLPVLG